MDFILLGVAYICVLKILLSFVLDMFKFFANGFIHLGHVHNRAAFSKVNFSPAVKQDILSILTSTLPELGGFHSGSACLSSLSYIQVILFLDLCTSSHTCYDQFLTKFSEKIPGIPSLDTSLLFHAMFYETKPSSLHWTQPYLLSSGECPGVV